MEIELKQTVVLDNGTLTSRAGFAGETEPRFVFPSVVGRPKNKEIELPWPYYIGDDIASHKSLLTCKHPVEHSMVTHWDDMEKLWAHTFNKLLQINTKEHAVILTEPIMNPKANREKLTQILFEMFKSPALYIGAQPVMSLRSTGMNSGLVVECGDSVSYIVPVYEGHFLPHATMHLDIAGRDITDFLCKLLDGGEHSFRTYAERELADDIKQKLCYVALDYNLEKKQTSLVRSYQLPAGTVVKVGSERIQAPEALFNPPLVGEQSEGLHWFVNCSIQKVQKELREIMYENIVVFGGTAKIPGLADRLAKEVKLLSPDTTVEVTTPNSQQPSWHGASLLASKLPEFEDMLVTFIEYDEYGPGISHRKFF